MAQLDHPASSATAPAAEDLSAPAKLGVVPKQVGLVRKLLRFFGVAALVAYFGFAAVVLALQFWVLPQIEANPQAIAEVISRNLGQRVTIGSVDSGWQRLRPYLDLTDVRLHDQEGRVALSLPSVSCTLSWDTLALGRLHFHSLSLDKPELNIRRDSAGALYIAGIKLDTSGPASGFSDWLVTQREVIVRDAQLSWDDELRQAPKLALADFNFVMRNRGSHHRFALRAQPPRELAAALDLRGDLEGATFGQLQDWNGKLYAELVYADLAAWRAWIDYPLEINRGQGGLRLWVGFAERQLAEITGDLALGDINARLAADLPILEMRSLQGRLSAKRVDGGYAIAGKQVTLALQSGATLPPAQFSVKWLPGEGKRVEQGEVRIDALELRPLALLAEYLPLPQRVRDVLADAAPQGSIGDAHFDWQGPLPNPQRFTLRGHFDQLGMRTYARLPGFSGISGNIDGNEKSGSVLLNSVKSSIALPQAFVDPVRNFDKFNAQVAWNHARGALQLKLSNIAFVNADLAGTAFGTYSTAADGPGVIDLTARVSRVDARQVPHYIPFIDRPVLDWLDHALLGGHASDVSLRLKGDLKEFPFQNAKIGVFQITANVADGTLQYADGWPTIDAINAVLRFDGRRMEIVSSKASVFGAKVTHARVAMPDLFTPERALDISGQAEGPTAEFLKFVVRSPVNRMIDGFTEKMSAVGNGRLQLKLELPLAHLAEAKVAGSYQFIGNQVGIDADWPPVTQVSGRLEFSQGGVSMRAVNAQFLGGPATVSVTTQREGGITVNARGSINASLLHASLDVPLLRQLSGSAAWTASVNIRDHSASVLVESGLQGLVSALPAPLNKASATALPLRFERTVTFEEQRTGVLPSAERSTLELGKVLHMELHRGADNGKMVIERGAIGINEAPKLPEKGVVINGNAPTLDLDQWLGLLAGMGGAQSQLSSLNLKVGALDIYGKRIHDVALRAAFLGSDWIATVDARELEGDVRWRSVGKGRVSARLAHFTFPEPTPGKRVDDTPPKDLPGLDIVADNLVVRDKKLGRLELAASNAGRDWRIEKLKVSNAEAQLNADGLWQGAAAQQSTSLNLKLDISNLGKFLDRIGYPGSMQRGSARLQGKLGWAGNPQSIDYASLTGEVSLVAEKGQFLKIEPGIGKLLGILSLQALPRRITLDFRDIFSEGFAFDNITGSAVITKGVMHTQDFAMGGPSAQAAMTGDIDLARETQSLRVRVVPSVGDSLSLAGLVLANPIAGVGAFLAQRLFKDPLGQVFAYEYAVSGTWVDPKVEKVRRQPRNDGPSDGGSE